jgi:hypothetical protein
MYNLNASTIPNTTANIFSVLRATTLTAPVREAQSDVGMTCRTSREHLSSLYVPYVQYVPYCTLTSDCRYCVTQATLSFDVVVDCCSMIARVCYTRWFQSSYLICRTVSHVSARSGATRWLSGGRKQDLVVSILGPPNAGMTFLVE